MWVVGCCMGNIVLCQATVCICHVTIAEQTDWVTQFKDVM